MFFRAQKLKKMVLAIFTHISIGGGGVIRLGLLFGDRKIQYSNDFFVLPGPTWTAAELQGPLRTYADLHRPP